eukprot:1158923-Pelagomonas_calceolata.AAC.3
MHQAQARAYEAFVHASMRAHSHPLSPQDLVFGGFGAVGEQAINEAAQAPWMLPLMENDMNKKKAVLARRPHASRKGFLISKLARVPPQVGKQSLHTSWCPYWGCGLPNTVSPNVTAGGVTCSM